MNEKICYIVGSGENYKLDFLVKKEDFVIAADGGLNYLQSKNISIDLIIGDFDSFSYNSISDLNIKSLVLDKEKEETDMLAAVKKGMDKGYKLFYIYCGTGNRFDHTFANIQILFFLSKNKMRGHLIDKNQIMTAVTNNSIKFSSDYNGYISVFSYSNISSGVFIKGLKYELENATIRNTYPIGVSNEFIGVESSITVKNGSLLIIFPRKSKKV
ncbi:MAG: thiamine diphosphokinase [Candidatus Improbicoccus pseudotrichonymphae]|uniref:Thiamine diphosphokinase n=1 Tax=Candidatus Improbicoccus pseudotrichonymphae TaxID=3033792 RepID=A0AA48I849_9FIRM|nr:MAG: thiamine diphosphokinase [Candidatus Improbicoccus pseudotrichonymphae]